jgi:hypothetical protein
MSDIDNVSAGFRRTTADGGSTSVDVNVQRDPAGNGSLVSPSLTTGGLTGDGRQWSVGAQAGPDGFRIEGSLKPREGEVVQTTTQQEYKLMDGTTRTIELPAYSTQYPDPGVNRNAVGVTVTGTPQQVAGDPLNVTATPQASLAVGGNANGTTVVTGDVRAQLDSLLGQRDVGVQAQYNSQTPGVAVTPYQTDRDGNAALGNTMDALYAPSRPQPATSPAAVNPEQAAAALREDPLYKQALGALQQQGYPLNPAPDSAADRLAAGIAIAAKQQDVDRIDGVSVGSTVVNAQGNTDRNVFFYKGEPNSDHRISEQAAIATPVADQAVKAQADQGQTPQAPQVASPQLDTQAQEPKARSMQ